MIESIYDRINDYGSVKIMLASSNDIRSWSFGEVKKPETINYRTYRPEKDGLFCERIFGPERDWECSCGKYKGTKFKGIICDRCGVKVTHSRVRRKRMGHINLAAPVVHIWFFKAMPSRLSNLLAMKSSDVEKIVYFQDYVVIDPGETPLKANQLLTEDEYRDALSKYGNSFKAGMGAEAVKELVYKLDLRSLSIELHDEIIRTSSKQKIHDLSKRLKTVNAIIESSNDPANMIMEVCPVIPPDLRPLVMLESGNFATSDLNDLYRRIINRNNRLKKLIDLNAPEVIIRNEKRMLQQAVDALLDNGRCRRPVLGSNNRPLKCLTDMIKCKQGRFRENLLGKRVDYSVRSVIVVGPWLKLNQCGLPKKIALELYQPFIIRKLKERGLADTIKSAKRMLERRDEQVWDILEEVIYQHPVMLNRAPTLHRMGIQAFEPVLVEGNAIVLHPLVCKGFNADFDGDQMAVHLPLSIEAQVETHTLVLSTNNIFAPSNGSPNLSPSQDIVLGNYYITTMLDDMKGEGSLYRDFNEAITAYQLGTVSVHAKVKVRLPEGKIVRGENGDIKNVKILETTPGRCLFNDSLPEEMPFYNLVMHQKQLGKVISDCCEMCGTGPTIDLLDTVKELGFKYATLAGISFGVTDLKIPDEKQEIITRTQNQVDRIINNFQNGVLTEGERYNQIIDAWTHARIAVTNAMMEGLKNDTRDGKAYLNPIWVMRHSGARGSVDQIQQLAGMRALMAKPSGEIIETPIKSNFREGLNVLEYFSSTHGARKGLADTALKTADSGYLTRKLADVAQNVIVSTHDCGTLQGVTKTTIFKGEQVDVPLSQLIIGRTARDNVRDPLRDEMIVRENEVISPEAARRIEELGLDSFRVRSPLTCDCAVGVCAKCYGWDMSTSRLVEEGMAVGIIAAQSIGEPGTQLTMRTFHTGGIASRSVTESSQRATRSGVVQYREMNVVKVKFKDGSERNVSIKRNAEIAIVDNKGRELDKFKVPYGSWMMCQDGEPVKKGQPIYEWDPHRTPILAEVGGCIRLVDVIEGETMRIEEERKGQKGHPVVIEHKGDRHPQVIIEDKDGKILDVHYLPAKARIEVGDGEEVQAGQLLARLPRGGGGTQDITGGLPRVTEIFEARKPKDPAAMAEISGIVELKSDKRRGKMTIVVRSDSGMEREHHVPRDRHLNVHTGDYVEAGDALTEGPLVPHDILRIKGEDALEKYLLIEVQNVYRAQNVSISDKHVEIIVSQMLRKVEIESVGDSELLPGEVVDKYEFRSANEKLAKSLVITDIGDTELREGQVVTKEELGRMNEKMELIGGEPAKGKKPRPATGNTLLLGITKASLQSESFISAASFQETTKVLTEASLSGKVDNLIGLKENVILGHLIPAGTGFRPHLEMKVKHLVEAPVSEELKDAKDAEAKADAAVKEALGLN